MLFKEDSSDVILLDNTQTVASKDPLSTTEIMAILPPLPFPKEGNYSFEVLDAAGELLSSIRREVVKSEDL